MPTTCIKSVTDSTLRESAEGYSKDVQSMSTGGLSRVGIVAATCIFKRTSYLISLKRDGDCAFCMCMISDRVDVA